MSDAALPLFPNAAGPDPVALARELALEAAPGHFDELRDPDADGALRPQWARFFSHVGLDGVGELNRRTQSLARQIRDNGVTYNVYADENGAQRPWSLDLFPLLVTPQDWAAVEAGVLQRTRLLNGMMADLYGPQTLLQRGLLPSALVHGHPGYMRAMQGVVPCGNTWLNVAAFDLARGPDGDWRVVSQRTQAPSGLGYLLENRIAIARQFPKAFAGLKVQRLGASYQALVRGIRAMAPGGEQARIALLTPGPHNETYFEHAYLARYLGLTLVEGSDLTVRDSRLFLKTLNGLEPVDALIKRLDDEWLDPLELRSDSTLGIPGLLQVLRAGNLLLANAPGSADVKLYQENLAKAGLAVQVWAVLAPCAVLCMHQPHCGRFASLACGHRGLGVHSGVQMAASIGTPAGLSWSALGFRFERSSCAWRSTK